jgi:hypothetical protein
MKEDSHTTDMSVHPTGLTDTNETVDTPTTKARELSALSFVAALIFIGVGLGAEPAGAHWLVGCLCVSGAFICYYMIMRLNGWKLGGFIMKKE